MPSFTITGTNHTSFTVSDLDRTVAFFCGALGFELLNKSPRDPAAIRRITGVDWAEMIVAYVQGPGHRLELIQYTAPSDRDALRPRPCDVGFAHVAYDVDDIDAAIEACAGYDVMPINPPTAIDKGPNAGGRVVYLRDPDGVTIEFIQKPQAPRQS